MNHTLFESHLTYCISAWGGIPPSKLQKLFSIQKRCMRILFGEKMCFDHVEFYQTCARVRTYKENMQPKSYVLEHSKFLFNKHNMLTIQNLYNQRLFMETFKILKTHTPISLHSLFNLSQTSTRHTIFAPKFSLEITRDNFINKSSRIWNEIANKIFDKPKLTELKRDQYIIIPGSCSNSDLSMSVCAAKHRVKQYLLGLQKLGNSVDWLPENYIIR